MEISVVDKPTGQHRLHKFEATADGAPAGEVVYQRSRGQMVFTHTEVGDEYGGMGIASQMAVAALDAARAEDAEVLPFCPFMRSYIEKHDEYLDLVPESERDRFDL